MSDTNGTHVAIGPVSAYALAKSKGYVGTEAEFSQYLAQAAVKAQETVTNAEIAEGYAAGTQDGTPVEIGSPYYENNAKYYMERTRESVPVDYTELINDVENLKSAINVLTPAATSSDVGKFLKVKTVSGAKVTEYEFGSGGGSGGTDDYSDLSNKPQINGVTLTGNKSLTDIGAVSYTEEELLRDEIPGTSTTITMDSNGNPTSIVHVANSTTVRTDTFVWGTGTVTETRTLANGKYITITTNLVTLAQTISDIQEVA